MMLHIQVLHLLRNSDNFVAHLRRIQKMGGRRLGVLTAWNEVSRQKCTGKLSYSTLQSRDADFELIACVRPSLPGCGHTFCFSTRD